jgi:hypothetical protein
MMKTALALLLLIASVSSFVTSRPAFSSTSALFSEPAEDTTDEEGGLDLNLEEMMTMFEAADKEEDFDEAISKVKKSEE